MGGLLGRNTNKFCTDDRAAARPRAIIGSKRPNTSTDDQDACHRRAGITLHEIERDVRRPLFSEAGSQIARRQASR
jgi:hypothetical protein